MRLYFKLLAQWSVNAAKSLAVRDGSLLSNHKKNQIFFAWNMETNFQNQMEYQKYDKHKLDRHFIENKMLTVVKKSKHIDM